MDAEVIIIGAGPVGMVMAGLLAPKGVPCILLAAAAGTTAPPAESPDPRVLAISPASREIMAAIDLWRRIPADRLGCIRRMQVWDENGAGEICFNCEEINEPALGYTVEQALLQAVVEPVLACLPALSIHHGAAVNSVLTTNDSIEVRTADRAYRGRLVIAADGAASVTRDLVGIAAQRRDYRQVALACVARFARGHEAIARQRFLTDG